MSAFTGVVASYFSTEAVIFAFIICAVSCNMRKRISCKLCNALMYALHFFKKSLNRLFFILSKLSYGKNERYNNGTKKTRWWFGGVGNSMFIRRLNITSLISVKEFFGQEVSRLLFWPRCIFDGQQTNGTRS